VKRAVPVRDNLPVPGSKRKAQKKAPQNDDEKKTDSDNLCIGKALAFHKCESLSLFIQFATARA
jgi:hypothetical protein